MKNRNKIIVVLGMHRSGTSAMTRALQVFGVELGDNLLPPTKGDNDKGYFEDKEIFDLNLSLFEALGWDWQSSKKVRIEDFESDTFQPLKEKALNLLKTRLETYPLYAFKDPAVVKLFPFWQSIFKALEVEPRYLIALRNPKSVVQSLMKGKRGDIKPEKAYLLWLDYTLLSCSQTEGAKRLVIEYDELLDNPLLQLQNISACFDLPLDVKSEEAKTFLNEFLTSDLRHTKYSLDDVSQDVGVPADVPSVYELLQGFAVNMANINEEPEIEAVRYYQARYNAFQSVFDYVYYLEQQYLQQSNNRLTDHEYIDGLNSIIHEQGKAIEIQKNDLEIKVQDIKVLQDSLERITSSGLWKLTAPARYLLNKINRK